MCLILHDFSLFLFLLSFFSLLSSCFPPGHQLHLPRCGGQIPCALQIMRTLALLPRTTLSHCQRTKITRAPCRRRIGGAGPRAENFGVLITAYHKVLSEGCESRNNHQYAVVVQDLGHPTDPVVSVQKEKLLRKHNGACKSSWSQNRKPKIIYTDNSLYFGKACEDRSWNHCTSTPHRSETNGIAERAVRRLKEGTSAVLLPFGSK